MRHIDYLVVAAPLAQEVTAEIDLSSPWSPHLGMKISIRTEACCKWEFNYPHIKPIPAGSGPPRQSWLRYFAEAEEKLSGHTWDSPFRTEQKEK